jgi:hypothetical protein
MRFRLLISALAAFGFPAESHVGGPAGYRAKTHRGVHHYRRVCCFVGGHRFGYQHTPFTFNDSNDYPGYYNNQTFWERVQTQRNYPVQY